MREQSPEEYVIALEKRFKRKKRLQTFLLDASMSAMMIMSSSDAKTVFEEIHKIDTLPHD